jgi:glycosyltransferase involved in cell wall biosynthesis
MQNLPRGIIAKCLALVFYATLEYNIHLMLNYEPQIEFTVIITAYNRKGFLLKSVNSVLSQNLERSRYEIIVSKNFEDTEIDKFLLENGVILILNKEPGIGQRLHECISISRGKIISFLEDDDLWLSNRLSTISKEFSNDATLGYYHNSYFPIDEMGKLTREWIHHSNIKKTTLISRGMDYSYILPKVMRFSPNFNLSSICISRELYIKLEGDLSKLPNAIDIYFFLEALSLNFNVLLDTRKLTKYMIHESNMNKSGSFPVFVSESLGVYRSHLESTKIMVEMIKDIYVKCIAKSYLKEWEIRVCILLSRGKRNSVVKVIFSDVKLFFIRRDYSKYFFLIGLLSILFPNAVRRGYFFYLKNSLIKYGSNRTHPY